MPSRELEKFVRQAKLSPEMLELTVLLRSELRNQAFEAGVFGVDLLGNRAGAVLQVGENVTHERFPLVAPLCGPGEGLTRKLGGCTLDCGHSVKLFGQIDSQEQGTRAETLSRRDEQRSIRTVNLDWLYAGPRTRGFTLKPADKFDFRHDAPLTEPRGDACTLTRLSTVKKQKRSTRSRS
jgi:hypothetical protein